MNSDPMPISAEHSKNHHHTLIQVALAVPIGDFFDYLCPTEFALPDIGSRVQVPFGNRQMIGIVVGKINLADSTVRLDKLKFIQAIIDQTAIIDTDTLTMAHWLAHYYHYPLGETLAVMLPAVVKQGKPIDDKQDYWRINPDTTINQLSHKQAMIYHTLLDNHQHHWINKDVLASLKLRPSMLTPLIKKNLISHQQCPPIAPPIAQLKQSPPPPTNEQQHAIIALKHAIDDKRYQAFLLDGVTGSGKTEVYLQAIWHALQKGQQVLVLVPEIGLTPQTYERFANRFHARIEILHSHLNDKERYLGWQAAKNNAAQIIIATRSAVFYPFAKLGLIVIDEAHDQSYKQQDHLRYHACDVAMMIAHKKRIPIVLGTATPSLEQLHLCQLGKLHHLPLSIATNAKRTRFFISDKRLGSTTHLNQAGQHVSSDLTAESIAAIKAKLDKGEQVLIFLNKRGYAPILLCQSCGYQADCVRCTSHLTLHKLPHPTLKCHHCGYQTFVPVHCPACQSSNLITLGQGTAQLHEHLHALFANPQTTHTPYPVIQIDKDTTRNKGDWQALYEQVLSGKPMILVGTQMLAKGHHFPKVTLVVIVDADAGFSAPNFRAAEQICQQIIQVAGRAGRADKAGEVIIQSFKPDHPLLQVLIKQGYHAAATRLLGERHLLNLPPYRHAALITAQAYHHQDAQNAIINLKSTLEHTIKTGFAGQSISILAPINAPLGKKNHLYCVQMVILSAQRATLHTLITSWWTNAKTHIHKKIRLSLDIDPSAW